MCLFQGSEVFYHHINFIQTSFLNSTFTKSCYDLSHDHSVFICVTSCSGSHTSVVAGENLHQSFMIPRNDCSSLLNLGGLFLSVHAIGGLVSLSAWKLFHQKRGCLHTEMTFHLFYLRFSFPQTCSTLHSV